MKLWSQFAKTGDPNYEGMGVTWLPYGLAEGEDHYLEIADPLQVGTDPASAFIPAPAAPLPALTPYHNDTYGFTIQYPTTWTDRTMLAHEIFRKGGLMGVPTVRVIVRPATDEDTLESVFAAHLTADGGKTIHDFALTSEEINGVVYDKAVVDYRSAYTYDSRIIGTKMPGTDDWIIFEVYTVGAYNPPQLPDAILQTVIWDD